MTDEAEGDLDRLLGHLARNSPGATSRLAKQFGAALARVRSMPLSCGLAYEDSGHPEDLRHLLFGIDRRRKYRALFVVRADEVVIPTIRAPGDKPAQPEELRG